MKRIPRMMAVHAVLFTLALAFLWLPCLVATDRESAIWDTLVQTSILASLGVGLLMALNILLQVRRIRREESTSGTPRP